MNAGALWTPHNRGLDQLEHPRAGRGSEIPGEHSLSGQRLESSALRTPARTGARSIRTSTATAIAMDPDSPATLYAGTHLGVMKTQSGGSQWSALRLATLPEELAARRWLRCRSLAARQSPRRWRRSRLGARSRARFRRCRSSIGKRRRRTLRRRLSSRRPSPSRRRRWRGAGNSRRKSRQARRWPPPASSRIASDTGRPSRTEAARPYAAASARGPQGVDDLAGHAWPARAPAVLALAGPGVSGSRRDGPARAHDGASRAASETRGTVARP